MMKLKISDMMDNIQDDTVLFQIKEIASSDKIKEVAMNKLHANSNTHARTRKVSAMLIAAVLATILLAGTTLAVYYFSMKDLEGPAVQVGGEEAHTLSLNGLKGSPEYEAAQEWERYVEAWYAKGENLAVPDLAPDAYTQYNAFSQDAKDTLDDILSKYNLRMHDAATQVNSLDELYSGLGVSDFMPIVGDNGTFPVSGTFYDDGTFTLNGAAALPDGADVRYQFYCFTKGTFTRVGYLLADVNDFEEWVYTTSHGDDILLAIGANKSILAVNLDKSFVFVNILSGAENSDDNRSSYGAKPVGKRDLEALADSFDFAAIRGLAR